MLNSQTPIIPIGLGIEVELLKDDHQLKVMHNIPLSHDMPILIPEQSGDSNPKFEEEKVPYSIVIN